MDLSNVHQWRGIGGDNGVATVFDLKQIFFTNLQLLGFDAAAMEIKHRIPFNKEMFDLPNKAGGEAVLYFLFNRLNPTMCRQQFRDCWPVTDKKSESAFRKICCIWLQNIQKEESDAKLPRINASLFLSPGGDKFCHLLFAFSSFVMVHTIRKEHGIKDSGVLGYPTLTSQNKELGDIMETTVHCAAIRHRKQFLETLGQMSCVKQNWHAYADEVTKSLRSRTRDVRDLEREKRDQVHNAAHKGVERGSPIPADRMSHDINMSVHAASRAHRVQQVRGLWKGVEGYIERYQEEKEIVTSIVDRTLEKHSIDAAKIQISIPHLMLRECEQEIRRRQVDNIYEGGDLNLVSVLQLWNLAISMYIHRLNEDGLKDLTEEAHNMMSQAHTHQAYLANASALREKMAKEIHLKKASVGRLRRHFRTEAMSSGLGMTAPSPPVTFEPSRGHSGSTPTGPVLQMTPDQADTPEAAMKIASTVSHSSRRNLVESFQPRAFGVTENQNRNRNNSNRLPQPTGGSSVSRSKVSKVPTKAGGSSKAKADIQPRVVRHISRQPATSTASAQKKAPPHSASKKAQGSYSQHKASTLERASHSQAEDLDRTPVPSDHNNSATETPRHRAHNILADKIVWAVMHGDGDEAGDYLPNRRGLDPSHLPSASKPAATNTHLSSLPPPHSTAAVSHSARSLQSLFSEVDSVLSPHSQSAVRGRARERPPLRKESVGSDGEAGFGRARSPVTLVQQAGWGHSAAAGHSPQPGGARGSRREGDRGEFEAEDINMQDPIAALSEEAFVTHDLIEHSPLAVDIRRMWKDAISDDAAKEESAPVKDLSADWLDSDRSSVVSTHTLTPTGPLSSSSNTSASPQLLQTSSQSRLTHSPSTAARTLTPTATQFSSSSTSASPQLLQSRSQSRHTPSASTAARTLTPTAPQSSSTSDSPQFLQSRSQSRHTPSASTGQGDHSDDNDHQDTSDAERTELFVQRVEQRAREPQLRVAREKPGKAAHQVMINNTIAFSTSFDEDPFHGDAERSRGDSVLEWEERLSALYDDPEVENRDASEEGVGGRGDDDMVAFTSAVDSLLQTKSPIADHSATPERKVDPPLISFTPQQPLPSRSGQGAGASASSALSDKLPRPLANQENMTRNRMSPPLGENSDSMQTPLKHATDPVKASQEKASDKENHGSVQPQNGQYDFKQSPDQNRAAAVETSPAKKVTFSPRSAPGYTEVEDLLGDDDLINISGASPLNESFTPLQSGLFLQGKSPSRRTVSKPSNGQLSQTGSSTATSSFLDAANFESLGEDLAAQLRRLKRVKEEAYGRARVGGAVADGEGKEEESGGADGGATLLSATTQRPATVGRELQLPDLASNPWDIFDEDDTILLPPSP